MNMSKSWLLEPALASAVARNIQREVDAVVQEYLDGTPLRPEKTPLTPNRKERRRMAALFPKGYISPVTEPSAPHGFDPSASYYIAETLRQIEEVDLIKGK